MWVNALIWCIKWPSNPASAQHPCLFGGGAGRRLLSFQMFHFACLPCLDFCLPQPLSYNRNIAAMLRCGKKYYPRWNEQTEQVVCHFFSFTSGFQLPPLKRQKRPTLSFWIRRLQQVSVTGMKNQSSDTRCSQIESLLNPLTMSGTDKEREKRGEKGRHTQTDRERETDRKV